MQKLLFSFAAMAIASSGFFSCASLTSSGRHQNVLILSEPSGAQILVSGKHVGFTPKYVELRRGRNLQLQLLAGDEKH